VGAKKKYVYLLSSSESDKILISGNNAFCFVIPRFSNDYNTKYLYSLSVPYNILLRAYE
jgi:hypothetical protein